MWLPQLHAMTTETLTAWVVEQVTQEHLGYPAVMVTTENEIALIRDRISRKG